MAAPPLPGSDRASLDGTSLWVWPDAVLYVGPSLDPGLHRGSVLCLAVGVDDDIEVHGPHGQLAAGRSALIRPGVLHRVRAGGATTAFLYLDPRSGRGQCCRGLFGAADGDVLHGHPDEATLLDLLRGGGAANEVLECAAPRADTVLDDRVAAALRRLWVEPTTTAHQLACEVGLSRSRLLELFARDVGMSMRRYRLWARMQRVVVGVRDGHDLTRASADAGFASPSHFSDSFRAMFGLKASSLLTAELQLHVVQGVEPPATS